VDALCPAEIRAAFPRHERRRVVLPIEPRWAQLDFLGWIHRSGHLGFVVCRTDNGPTGLVLERHVARAPGQRRLMCDICCTLHAQGGVATFTRWNRTQMRARSHMLCADLRCSLYVRELIKTDCIQMAETITRGEKIARLNDNMRRFLGTMTFADGEPKK